MRSVPTAIALPGHHLRIFEHVERHAGCLRCQREAVVLCRRDDARKLDTVLAQRLEHQRAEIPGSHQRDLHRTSRTVE
jgi:hypothetical protein